MASEFELLVLGDANPDLILFGDVEPAFGQAETLVERAELVLGGSGAITAAGAARLGVRTAFVGVVGDDLFGRFVKDALEAREVDTRGLVVDPGRPTGLSVILSRPSDRAILTSIGSIGDLRSEMLDLDLVRSSRHVHVSSYYLQRSLAPDLLRLFDAVHAAGGTTSIDPNWDPAELWNLGLLDLLAGTDVFFPNEAEARAIAGLGDSEAAAGSLAARGPAVAMKLGEGGGLVASDGEVVRQEPVEVDVVDTTGAGDSFDAGFLAGRVNGWPLSGCLALAVACGALSTRAAGGTAAQPTIEEALAAVDETT